MKSKVLLSPPGVLQREDIYLRRHWRRVQHLCNEFWLRWKKEYVHFLQKRQRWLKPRQNLQVGDVIVVAEHDNCWPLARVITHKLLAISTGNYGCEGRRWSGSEGEGNGWR